MSYEAESILKPSYKKFKNRTYTTDELAQLNQFKNPISINIDKTKLFNPSAFKDKLEAFEIGENSGFYYIPNPFNYEILIQLIVDAICKWPNSDNRMNVDIETERPEHIWKATLQEIESGLKLSESWLYKLRWTSMGYHYQWTDRIYRSECHSHIPDNLEMIMKDIIKVIGWKEFIPEAAIVNYYHLNSAMCFHQDHAELAKDVPLVSMSLGQPAVYLLGTADPRSVPVPITLYHGDVVVMSGASRLAYHAVPKVVKMTDEMLTERLFGSSTSVEEALTRLASTVVEEGEGGSSRDDTAGLIWNYLCCSRININMRQVLEQGQLFPDSFSD